jgi:hypothetical protein
MEFNKKVVNKSSDPYYDLFDGGYIKPEEMLVNPNEIAMVKNAIKIVKQFLDEAEEKELLIII